MEELIKELISTERIKADYDEDWICIELVNKLEDKYFEYSELYSNSYDFNRNAIDNSNLYDCVNRFRDAILCQEEITYT